MTALAIAVWLLIGTNVTTAAFLFLALQSLIRRESATHQPEGAHRVRV